MSGDRLTPLDATFLELEQADRSAHMHIGSLMIFEARPGLPPTLKRLQRHLERRLFALPRYRCRLSGPHTGGLHWPDWVIDPGFDVTAHVQHVQLAEPGGRQELLDWAADFWSERLDRSRPLWEARLVTGLDDGRWAVATKTHHALVDGVGSVDVTHVLLDAARTPGRGRQSAPAPQPAESHGPIGLLSGAAHAGLDTALHPGRLREIVMHAKAMADVMIHDEIVAAPHSSINAPLSPGRRYRVVSADLDQIKGVKNALGGTVNDVVLSAVTGGLRSLLLERGEDVDAPGLRAMVPVNVRGADERLDLGNKVSSLFVHLPVMEPDAGRRYLLVKGDTDELKRTGQAGGAGELVALGGLAPPVVHSLFARTALATRLFNITVTNVPGPQLPLYAFGARMEEVWPLVPLAAGHTLGVAVISYDGRVFFGLSADSETDDLDLLAVGVETAIDELVVLGEGGQAMAARA
jgi:diacylglycerol O-acyltransferase / wax synthase